MDNSYINSTIQQLVLTILPKVSEYWGNNYSRVGNTDEKVGTTEFWTQGVLWENVLWPNMCKHMPLI